MPIAHVGLTVDSAGAIDAAELSRVAAAIQRQVTRDFSPTWGVHATVDAFPHLEDVPAEYWPVVLTGRHLGDDEGFHLTHDGQPFAVVEAIAEWSLTASHEILEMLADPTGARTIEGPPPAFASGATAVGEAVVDYLVEICDPCQSARDAYVDPAKDAAAHIVWAERSVGGAPGANGFAVVRVVDGGLEQTFHDETGAVRFTTRA